MLMPWSILRPGFAPPFWIYTIPGNQTVHNVTIPLGFNHVKNIFNEDGLGRRPERTVDAVESKCALVIICPQICDKGYYMMGTAHVLAGQENVVRISPVVAKGRFGLDKIGEIQSLKGLGDSEARSSLPSIRPVFFSTPVEPFEPYYTVPTND